MSEISKYILMIAGIILITIIVELVMSEGQMNRYIKNILSFFVIAVIIYPVPKLLSNESILEVFETTKYELQEDFIYKNNMIKISNLENSIIQKMNDDGYKNLEIEIECMDMLASDLEYEKVLIDLNSVVFEENANVKDKIGLQNLMLELLQKDYGIKKEIVVYAEV